MRRSLLALLFGAAAAASAAPTAPAAPQPDLLLGVSEGTSGGLDHAQVIVKYKGLADLIGKAIERRVSVVFVREFAQLGEGMKSGRFDFVMARPSDYPAVGMRDHGYRYVASAKPDGQCLVVVSKDSPLKTLADAKGKRWVLPEPSAYMTRFCTAELRDRGIRVENEKVSHVREQGAIGMYLEAGFADVGGVASYSGIARGWEAKGHRILHRSVSQPYFPLIAGRRVSAADIAAVQRQLAAMPDTSAGQAVLDKIGVKEFDTGQKDRLAALLVWLGR